MEISHTSSQMSSTTFSTLIPRLPRLPSFPPLFPSLARALVRENRANEGQLNLRRIHSRNSQLVEMFALIYVGFTAEIAS